MKRVLSIVFICCLIFSLVGCAKVVSTEYEDVEVTVVDKYHQRMFMTPIRVGKVTSMVTHPAVYRITVEYNDVRYSFSESSTYNRYKDKVGQTIIGTLEIRTYDNGTVKYDIVGLQ